MATESARFLMNITKKQKLVLKAIELEPDAVDDDALLISTVWIMEGFDSRMKLYENLKRLTRAETITRRRRELYNMNLIEYSAEAQRRRMEAFKNERDMHSDYTPAVHVSFKD